MLWLAPVLTWKHPPLDTTAAASRDTAGTQATLLALVSGPHFQQVQMLPVLTPAIQQSLQQKV
jgi:hypothetical protein